MNRCSQGNLNQALTTVISGLPKGDLCIGFALDWLRDEGVSYLGCQETDKMPPSTGEIDTSSALNRFVRFWIYSHHIYNKSKRRSILEMARSADLTGFCLPGKPGVICVEGTEADCEDFWYRIRQVPWKRIVCLKKEVEEEEEHKTVENHKQLRRFQKFEEVHFEVAKSNGRDFKMDMGAFYGFLEQHHCGYVFKDYFGIEGKNK